MTATQQVTDAEHYAIPILRKYFSIAEIAQFLEYSERTISDHSSDTESPSEKKANAEKRGPKTDEVAPYRDHILSLLQASRWDIHATSIHADLVKKYGVQFSARTVQRFVNDLKIEFGLMKLPPETQPTRRGKHQSLTDDQHLLIHKLASHVVPNIIAECVGCGVSTVRKHIKDPKLPSAKKQEQSFKGRRPGPEKLARYMILLYLLLLTRWTATAKDLHRYIDENFPQLTCNVRTVEREVNDIMIKAKVPKSVYAMRKKRPGEMIQLDMTDVSDLGVTIDGQAFRHRFAIATLPFSGYIHCEVVQGGESFEALQTTLINAIAAFEGVPELIQTDSLSAAYRNLLNDPEQDATENFFALCQQLGSLPIRINRQCPNENGSTESMNRHFSTEVRDALVCRGSKDFASVADYQDFIAEVRTERNEKKKDLLAEEQNHLQPVSDDLKNSYDKVIINVRNTGCFCHDSVMYSAPSHLSGGRFNSKLHSDKIELYHQGEVELCVDRVKPGNPDQIRAVIDFRHWLDMFQQKPNAFDDHEYRDEFFPSPEYQHLYQLALTQMDKVKACRYLMAVLQIANQQNCVEELSATIAESLQQNQLPPLTDLQTQFGYQATASKPAVEPPRKKRSAQQRANTTMFSNKTADNAKLLAITSNSFLQALLLLCFAMVQIIIRTESSRKQLSATSIQDLVHTSANGDLLQQLCAKFSASDDHNNEANRNHLEQSSILLPKVFTTMLSGFLNQQQDSMIPSLALE